MDNEIWKPIKDFPKYEASSFGNVKSYKKGIHHILKGYMTHNGYLQVKLFNYNTKKRKGFFIHHLVLNAFISSCPLNYSTNHKNASKIDNRLENLEWATSSDNYTHAYRHGLQKPGVRNLTEKKVKDVHKLLRQGMLQKKIAILFNISPSHVSTIKNSKCWQYIV